MLNSQPASMPFQHPPFPSITLPSVTSAPLLKSGGTGTKHISLSMSKNNIRDTFGAPAVHPPSLLYALFSLQGFPHFPQLVPSLSTVTTNLELISARPYIRPALKYIASFPLRSLHYAQVELHQTQASLASHVAKVCALDDMIDEHDTITVECATFRDLIHASSLCTHRHSSRTYTRDAVVMNQKNMTRPASM
ncbi:hypothetical protein K503DRAFT_94126 [Rhizopogon vinicolor AM-OR11-026]|uniref:Uncharacterized protein n=1 Tax=Rhizopogon vinicolor AM-OR11-026 TaxID=1314800 RepID=A0A1B7N3A1_9AGAM|nr:hypothetical protein K503DRAFT_94126 [Rhizopogon vinicolor AM-OR11-026]